MATLRQRSEPSTKPATAETTRPTHQRASSSIHSHSGLCHHADADDEAQALLNALRGSADRGSRITLIGLASNVGLTAVKGAAGWALGSASLLADAGHSLSDLLGDFVVLFCWRISRKPATPSYPYGYGKYESLGTLVVAVLLVLGGFGIGLHSYNSLFGDADAAAHSHSHSHSHSHHDPAAGVDPNAAWFALGSILVKEWLYRATLRVAEEEHSNVLTASAYHHRSDAYSSVVALLAIGGSWIGFTAADPMGGLLVAGMILLQGAQVGLASVKELLDQTSDPTLLSDLRAFLLDSPSSSAPEGKRTRISGVSNLRTYKSGALHLVDVVLDVAPSLSVRETASLERDLTKRIREAFPVVTEVAARFKPVEG